MCDSITVSRLLSDLEAELGDYYKKYKKQYDVIKQKSKIKSDHMMVNKSSDINHIDYIIPTDGEEKKKQYAQFISREYHIRGIPLQGFQLEDWHSALRACLVMENRISFLVQVHQWDETGRKSVPLIEVVELLIPCVLHLENRADKKTLPASFDMDSIALLVVQRVMLVLRAAFP